MAEHFECSMESKSWCLAVEREGTQGPQMPVTLWSGAIQCEVLTKEAGLADEEIFSVAHIDYLRCASSIHSEET